MRVSQVLLATSVALVACSNNFVNATEAGAEVKTPTATTATPTEAKQENISEDDNSIFVHSVPFKLGNVTGTMVITIDKDSLKYVSEDDTTSTDSSNIYDFGQLEKNDSASGDEERGFFMFGATHFVQYKLMQKAGNWFKSVL